MNKRKSISDLAEKQLFVLAHVKEVISVLYRQYDLNGCTDIQNALYNLCEKELDEHPALIIELSNPTTAFGSINYFVRQMALKNVKM